MLLMLLLTMTAQTAWGEQLFVKTLTGKTITYSLNGVKLDQQPTQKGVFIHGNKKVVIK